MLYNNLVVSIVYKGSSYLFYLNKLFINLIVYNLFLSIITNNNKSFVLFIKIVLIKVIDFQLLKLNFFTFINIIIYYNSTTRNAGQTDHAGGAVGSRYARYAKYARKTPQRTRQFQNSWVIPRVSGRFGDAVIARELS